METEMNDKLILLTRLEAARKMSLSPRTIASIPEVYLPQLRFGKAVRYRESDLDLLAEGVAKGKIKIGPVNN